MPHLIYCFENKLLKLVFYNMPFQNLLLQNSPVWTIQLHNLPLQIRPAEFWAQNVPHKNYPQSFCTFFQIISEKCQEVT